MFQGFETHFESLRRMGRVFLFALSMAALVAVAGPFDPLEHVRDTIERARANGAENFAPTSLRLAEYDLRRAEKMIAANPARPLTFEHVVEMADYRARELEKVVAVLRAEPMTTEEIALRLVRERNPQMSPALSKNQNLELE